MRLLRVVSRILALLVAASRLAAAEGMAAVIVHVTGTPPAGVLVRLAPATRDGSRPPPPREARLTPPALAFRDVATGDFELTVGGASLALRIAALDRIVVEAAWTGPSPPRLRVVERATTSTGTTFDGDDLRDLPSARDVASLLETAEPVTVTDRIDGGGLWTADPGRLTAHGVSWTETTWLLDGIDVTDPRQGGRPLVLPHDDVLSAVTVISSAAPADLAGSAAALAMETRATPVGWHGRAHGDTAFGPSASGRPPAREGLEAWHDAGLAGSGATRDGRLGLLGALGARDSSRREREGTSPLAARLASLFARASWEVGDEDSLRVTLVRQWGRRPPEAGLWRAGGALARDRRGLAAAEWRRGRPSGSLWEARVSDTRERTTGAMPPSAVVERLDDGPLLAQVEDRPADRGRAEARLAWRPSLLHARGAHDLRLAFSASRETATVAPLAAVIGERVAGLAARAWEYQSNGGTRPSAQEATLVASDVFTTGRWTADLGVRADVVRGHAAGAGPGIAWSSVSPALAVRWSALSRDRLVLWGATSRRAHRLQLDWLEWGDPAAPRADVRRWADGDGDGRVGPSELGPLVGRAGPGAPVGALDPALRRPRSDEAVLAGEGRLGRTLLVRFAAVERRASRLIESVNVGLDASAYTTRLVPDPGGDLIGTEDDQLLPIAERRAPGSADSFLLTNPGGLEARYRGVELTFDARGGDWLRLRLSGTAHRVDGPPSSRGFRATENDPELVGELFDSPNADVHAEGRLFFDRAYAIKVSGRLRAPGDVHLGWIARYQDGQPFARVVVVPDLPQGADFVRAVPNGRHRFAYTLTVDARLEKGLRRGARRLSASLEAFNLLQTRHEVEEDVVSGAGFRRPTSVQPPRVMHAGLRLEF